MMLLLCGAATAQPILWLRADTGVVSVDGSALAWSDLSGAHHDVTAPDMQTAPIYIQDDRSGRPTLRFQGWNYLVAPAIFPTNHSYSIFVVARATNFGALTNFVSGDTRALWLDASRFPQVLHGTFYRQTISETPLWDSGVNVISVRYSEEDQQAKIAVNGGVEDSLYVGSTDDSAKYIGAFLRSYGFQGDMYEVQVFDSELSPQNFAKITDRLIDAYGIGRASPRPQPDRTFREAPRHMQLYARGDDDSATVRISGTFPATRFDSLRVILRKNGELVYSQTQKLQYDRADSPFDFAVRMHAELAEYSVEVRAIAPMEDSLVLMQDSLTSGDVLLVDGQSNAIFGYDEPTYSSEFARTIGIPYSPNVRDTLWQPALALKWGDANSVGAWAQRIERDIIEHEHIPVCCINGGASGTNIQSHERDTIREDDLRTIYGRMLYRVRKGGLGSAARYLVWDQGELNYDTQYFEYFRDLRQSWLHSYPNLKHIYVLQNRPNYCGWGNIALRNTQWHLQDSFPDVESIATAALTDQDGCHYYDSGMDSKGDRIWRSIARDFYGSTDTVGLRSPFLRKLEYSFSDHRRIIASFESATDLHITHDTIVDGVLRKLTDHLYLDDSTPIESISIQGTSLVLDLARPSTARHLTYLGDQYYNNSDEIYEGPWIVNDRGLGALLFYEYPISERNSTRVDESPAIRAWPDPAVSTLHLTRDEAEPTSVSVIDDKGVVVESLAWSASAGDELNVRISQLPQGAYLVRIASAKENRTSKFVISRP